MTSRAIGLHVPKTAGTSLATLVRSVLQSHESLVFASFHQNRVFGRPELFELDSHEHLRFVFGHRMSQEAVRFLWRDHTLLFTGLREPEERWISVFRQYVMVSQVFGTPCPTVQEIVGGNLNATTDWLVRNFPTAAELGGGTSDFEKAVSVLSVFDVIYDSSDLVPGVRPILRFLGIERDLDLHVNVSPDGTEEAARRMAEELGQMAGDDADARLYRFVQENVEVDERGFRRLKRNDLSVDRETLFREMPDRDACFSIMKAQLIEELVYEASLIGRLDELREQMRRRCAVSQEILEAIG